MQALGTLEIPITTDFGGCGGWIMASTNGLEPLRKSDSGALGSMIDVRVNIAFSDDNTSVKYR